MTTNKTDESTGARRLRLWPGVSLAVLLVLVRFAVPLVLPDAKLFSMIGGVIGGLAILLWWAFFSRASWSERLGAVAVMILVVAATSRVVDQSVRTGMMGMMLIIYSIPVLSIALVAWVMATLSLPRGTRRVALVATMVLASGLFTLLRTGGLTGDGVSDLHWRWAETPEERLLALSANEPATPLSPTATTAPDTRPTLQTEVPDSRLTSVLERPEKRDPVTAEHEPPAAAAHPTHAAGSAITRAGADWPGFRGAERDSIVRGTRIETDWSSRPPVELWRRPIGPGWSSFAIQGGVLYTQEQRGNNELVAAYSVTTGKPVWRHSDPVRFWESNGGAGPRATPTLHDGRVYTFGATGILNALDSRDGSVIWSRNAASDTATNTPEWGFSSSPLVMEDEVVVAVSGQLVAYDLATGHRRWSGPRHGGSYSSPHRTTIHGVDQILLLNGAGVTSVSPTSGAVLWEHLWPGSAIVQPALTPDGDVLVNTGGMTGGAGTRRLAVAHGPDGWKVEERWTSPGLKPYFNDFVVHAGHVFGFDGSILACIDLTDGKRKWKGGRYGNGQLMLLPDQDLLLVLSEEGELALVEAKPDQFRELARLPALEGKTWNHPVLAGDLLFVRNGQEMVAYRLPIVTP
jgi:outer membrane protein assembly factor BamB